MRGSLTDLGLERILVVCPVSEPFALAERIEVISPSALPQAVAAAH